MLQNLTGGFMEGAQFGQSVRRNRQLEKAIDLELADATDKQKSRRAMQDRERKLAGLEPNDWSQGYQPLKDPFAFRARDWIRNLFGGRQRQPRALPPPQQPGTAVRPAGVQGWTPEDANMQTMGMPMRAVTPFEDQPLSFNDGGEVEAEEEEVESRPSLLRRALPNYMGATDRYGAPLRESMERLVDPDSTLEQRGEAYRDTALGSLRLAGMQGAGLVNDVVGPVARPVGRMVKGALGFTGERPPISEAAAAGAPPEGLTPEEMEAEPPPEATPAPAQAPSRTALPSSAPDTDMGPINWADIDAFPDDMPTMATRDWVQYRAETVSDLIGQGLSPTEAHMQVTQLQQQGFLEYSGQAQALLEMGDMRGAARALKAAYQYFPNGVDARFGIHGDSLVVTGVNEETGEPTGQPMILNAERLAALRTNFQNPQAYLAWTKDWRDEAFRERQYQEVTRPMAEVQAQTALSRAAGGQTGVELPDEKYFAERVFAEVDDPDEARRLESAMSQVAANGPSIPRNQIFDVLITAYKNGTLDEVLQQLGVM